MMGGFVGGLFSKKTWNNFQIPGDPNFVAVNHQRLFSSGEPEAV